ncbi:GNAT family N-acetyltransferase [Paenibacillus lautus]|uniref:GNAT family N-acetyltransferase n=1 Tax=Paenibacillus lautus TaxID=1401 RepID=UPI001C1261D8|nr:GNAT family N-acetyltransferase [Paenibacillus lautus]MBU5345800.1 GNAT family N-acetyltransferase [Paenibacillus lautus]
MLNPNSTLPVITDRLMIRMLTRDDQEHIYNLCLQAFNNDWPSGWRMDYEQASNFLDWQINKYETFNVLTDSVYFAVVARDNSNFIGHCHVGCIDELAETEIGYGIAKEFRGVGYATEVAKALTQWALSTFNLKYVVATITDDNPSSLRVIEKVGFLKYGKMKIPSMDENKIFNYFRYYNQIVK